MSDPVEVSPPARRLARPRWLDPRLLGGVLLVLVSVVLGARLVGSAEDGDAVWAASRDLAAGTTVQADDLEVTTVRLAGSAAAYVDASRPAPAGYVLVRDVGAGELVPAAALSDASEGADRRLVSVPVDQHHFPAGLSRGQRVDVYVVAAASVGTTGPAPAPELVLPDAVVAQVSGADGGFGSAGGGLGFVLEVAAADVPAVVAAVASGTIQLVRLPSAGGS